MSEHSAEKSGDDVDLLAHSLGTHSLCTHAQECPQSRRGVMDVRRQLCRMHVQGSFARWWNSVKSGLGMDILVNLRDAQLLPCRKQLLSSQLKV